MKGLSMNATIEALKLLARNWKAVLTLFCLGGTVTVLGVIPGTEPVRETAINKIEATKAALFVSPTAVQ